MELDEYVTIILVVSNSGRLKLKGTGYDLDAVEVYYLQHGSSIVEKLLERLQLEPGFLIDLQQMELGRGGPFGVLTATYVTTLPALFDLESRSIPHNDTTSTPRSLAMGWPNYDFSKREVSISDFSRVSSRSKRLRLQNYGDDDLLKQRLLDFAETFKGKAMSSGGAFVLGEITRLANSNILDIRVSLSEALSTYYKSSDLKQIFSSNFNYISDEYDCITEFIAMFFKSCFPSSNI